jgi:hypothetical protein
MVGQERFGYFPPGRAGFSKVTRCKSETIGGHNRRNGYVHHPKIPVGYQAAFAGKPRSYKGR